jgi:hypothetical protein
MALKKHWIWVIIVYCQDGGDYIVIVHSDDVFVEITGDDLDKAKAAASSADFLDDKSDDEVLR